MRKNTFRVMIAAITASAALTAAVPAMAAAGGAVNKKEAFTKG